MELIYIREEDGYCWVSFLGPSPRYSQFFDTPSEAWSAFHEGRLTWRLHICF